VEAESQLSRRLLVSSALPTGVEQSPLVGQEDFAGVEVPKASHVFGAAIDTDHSPVRDQQIAELGRSNDAALG